MKVKELIEFLKKEDKEKEVLRETEEDYKSINFVFSESVGVILGNMKEKKICIRCHGSDNNCLTCKGQGRDYIEEELKEDMVNHPSHYTFGKIEVIDVIEDWQLGFHEGNCVKYIARAKHKGNELEDLKKAEWYLNRKINQLDLNKEK